MFCIPHFGGRQGNPQWHDEKVQRMIEIFSEHRRSEDWAQPFLERGHRLGIIASTDGHFGNPGYGYLKPTYDWEHQEIGMAAVAVYASAAHARIDLPTPCTTATCTPPAAIGSFSTSVPTNIRWEASSRPSRAPESCVSDRDGPIAPDRNQEKRRSGARRSQPQTIERSDSAGATRISTPRKPCYYYVRVVQANREEAISSPVWVN